MLTYEDLEHLANEFTKKAIHNESSLSEIIYNMGVLAKDTPVPQIEKYDSDFKRVANMIMKDCEDLHMLKTQNPNKSDFDLLLKRFSFHGLCMNLVRSYLAEKFSL